jgi:hypothetical protein
MKNLRRILFLVVFTAPIILPGCDRSSPPSDEDIRRAGTMGYCKGVLRNPRLPKEVRARAQVALCKWEDGHVDPEPILIHAVLEQGEGDNGAWLGAGISDEDNDAAGIGVREEHIGAEGEKHIVEETYPVFGYRSIGGFQSIPVVIRKAGQRKNEADWEKYLNRGIWNRELIPDLWISMPSPGKVEVKIWVYDHAGHKSDVVPLE